MAQPRGVMTYINIHTKIHKYMLGYTGGNSGNGIGDVFCLFTYTIILHITVQSDHVLVQLSF